ncbi:hypothetical protein BT63DRAFT_462313 [Microthyrium microscopicum]|uniref:Uncharacterized protein n=1 Tax=Microthyrium microscopicum TaxID=703497 RepID=A0A6A6UTE5_9PEZI|nr:hypothetical protein BT63DRAFT_462313 [Microthyrium microscopicum]
MEVHQPFNVFRLNPGVPLRFVLATPVTMFLFFIRIACWLGDEVVYYVSDLANDTSFKMRYARDVVQLKVASAAISGLDMLIGILAMVHLAGPGAMWRISEYLLLCMPQGTIFDTPNGTYRLVGKNFLLADSKESLRMFGPVLEEE